MKKIRVMLNNEFIILLGDRYTKMADKSVIKIMN